MAAVTNAHPFVITAADVVVTFNDGDDGIAALIEMVLDSRDSLTDHAGSPIVRQVVAGTTANTTPRRYGRYLRVWSTACRLPRVLACLVIFEAALCLGK